MNPQTQAKRIQAARIIAALAVAISICGPILHAQESIGERTASPNVRSTNIYLPYAQFQIPFNVDASGTQPAAVQLLVSTDGGATWQLHGRATPRERHFEFRAAAEGDYLFTVQTLDSAGIAFPSPEQPLRVRVDTSKPQASLRADLDHAGNLIVDLRVFDDHVDLNTAMMRVRTDRDPQWREVPVNTLGPVGQYYEGQVEILIPQCREVAIVFSVSDMAKNSGEANLLFPMPRTAANPSEMQLASTSAGNETAASIGTSVGINIPGAVNWDLKRGNGAGRFAQPPTAATTPTATATGAANSLSAKPATSAKQQGNFPTSPRITIPVDKPTGPGQLAKTALELELGPRINPEPEELLIPDALPAQQDSSEPAKPTNRNPERDTPLPPVDEIAENGFDHPYYCRSRTFSLDYSVEALGGSALSEVELWGSEDNGRSWQKWGSDPDRVSPFDVKVGNDGLFGFRMVLVGAGGAVLGNPKPGEDADAWIHVDTELPNAKITRAVYGVGSEAGMLVIDYACSDVDLAEQAITLSWSASPDGPWKVVAASLKNTGLYLWKADPDLPNRVYLKLEAVDKAGNIGTHRLDLPIDTKGLAPRGRIQGIRPIVAPK